MAEINITNLNILEGATPGLVSAEAGGDHLVPQSNEQSIILHIKNEDSSEHTVTLDDVNSDQPIGADAFDADVAIAVPAGEERLVNLRQLSRFIDSNGQINMTYDDVTSVTVGAYRVR